MNPKLVAKVSQKVEQAKCVETNRKFYTNLVALITETVLLCTGKIDMAVFKDMFLLTLLTFTAGNLINKYIVKKPM